MKQHKRKQDCVFLANFYVHQSNWMYCLLVLVSLKQ